MYWKKGAPPIPRLASEDYFLNADIPRINQTQAGTSVGLSQTGSMSSMGRIVNVNPNGVAVYKLVLRKV